VARGGGGGGNGAPRLTVAGQHRALAATVQQRMNGEQIGQPGAGLVATFEAMRGR
jgi:hypothetical protein